MLMVGMDVENRKKEVQAYNYEYIKPLKYPGPGEPPSKPELGFFELQSRHTDYTDCMNVRELFRKWFYDNFESDPNLTPGFSRRNFLYGYKWITTKSNNTHYRNGRIINFVELEHRGADTKKKGIPTAKQNEVSPDIIDGSPNPLRGMPHEEICILLDRYRRAGGRNKSRGTIALSLLTTEIKKDPVFVAKAIIDIYKNPGRYD